MACTACGQVMAAGPGGVFRSGSLGMAQGPGAAFRSGSLGAGAHPVVRTIRRPSKFDRRAISRVMSGLGEIAVDSSFILGAVVGVAGIMFFLRKGS
jgi:hypothetical protein